MGGLTITDVKIVGMCSKCRKEGDEIMKDKHGRIYRDDELACVGCAFGKEKEEIISSKENHEIIEGVMKKRYGYYIETKKEIRELILEALEDKDKLQENKDE